MVRAALGIFSMLAMAGAAHAQAPVALTVINNSNKTVEAISVYPVDADGEAIGDNIGGLYEAIAPGHTAQVELSLLQCQTVLAAVTLLDGREMRANVNVCNDNLTLNPE